MDRLQSPPCHACVMLTPLTQIAIRLHVESTRRPQHARRRGERGGKTRVLSPPFALHLSATQPHFVPALSATTTPFLPDIDLSTVPPTVPSTRSKRKVEN